MPGWGSNFFALRLSTNMAQNGIANHAALLSVADCKFNYKLFYRINTFTLMAYSMKKINTCKEKKSPKNAFQRKNKNSIAVYGKFINQSFCGTCRWFITRLLAPLSKATSFRTLL
jgi:hypothetical protein